MPGLRRAFFYADNTPSTPQTFCSRMPFPDIYALNLLLVKFPQNIQ